MPYIFICFLVVWWAKRGVAVGVAGYIGCVPRGLPQLRVCSLPEGLPQKCPLVLLALIGVTYPWDNTRCVTCIYLVLLYSSFLTYWLFPFRRSFPRRTPHNNTAHTWHVIHIVFYIPRCRRCFVGYTPPALVPVSTSRGGPYRLYILLPRRHSYRETETKARRPAFFPAVP